MKKIVGVLAVLCALVLGGCLEQKKDMSLPEITMKGTDVIKLVGTEYVDEGVFANDEQDGDITNKIEKTIYNGSSEIVNTIDGNKSETYTIKYNVSDNAGNKANEVTRIVVFSNLENNGPNLASKGSSFIHEYWMVGTEYTSWGTTIKFVSTIVKAPYMNQNAWDALYIKDLRRKFVKGNVSCYKYMDGKLIGEVTYKRL